jgi:hypothetical protein
MWVGVSRLFNTVARQLIDVARLLLVVSIFGIAATRLVIAAGV